MGAAGRTTAVQHQLDFAARERREREEGHAAELSARRAEREEDRAAELEARARRARLRTDADARRAESKAAAALRDARMWRYRTLRVEHPDWSRERCMEAVDEFFAKGSGDER